MSAIHTKWPVLEEHAVQAGDLGDDGAIRDDRVEAWVASAVSAYISRCPLVRELAAEPQLVMKQTMATLAPAAALGHPDGVLVTAGATELHPTSFTVAVRIRPLGGEREQPLNCTCVVRFEDVATGEPQSLGDDIRDELIALQHAARHSN